MNDREQKGLVIAALSKLVKSDDSWAVPSQSGKRPYKVDSDLQRCSCPDYETRQAKCKHIIAVEITIQREQSTTIDGQTVTTKTTETLKVSYSRDWTAYNDAQTNEKDMFEKLLAALCSGIAEPQQGGRGRPRLSYRDMIFSVASKTFSTVSARRFMCDLKDAHEKGFVSKVPHFNSIFNYLELEALTPILKALITQSALPLEALESDFAVDSSGFSTCQYVRWYDAKYGKEIDAHDWIKVHLMSGVRTHVVTSVEITGRNANDSPLLPGLVAETAKNFTVKEVSADKAYSSRENHDAIANVGAVPYIAFKKSTTGEVGGLFQKMFHYFSFNRDEFLAAYHKRSNVESTFHMIKSKFGASIRSKGKVAQTNEALCKILCHNICCLVQSMFEFGD